MENCNCAEVITALTASCQEKEKMQPIEGFEKVIICADLLLDCINEFESIEPAGEIIDTLQSAIDALGENAVFDFKYKSTPGVYYPAAEVDAALTATHEECERLRKRVSELEDANCNHRTRISLAKDALCRFYFKPDEVDDDIAPRIIELESHYDSVLAAALAERDKARAEALEEAAKVAEITTHKARYYNATYYLLGDKIAAAIRALSGATGEKAEK